jgi:hypothetical protein
MRGVISRGEATFSLDANRHVMNQRWRPAITNSLPVTENWTRVAQMAHFVANRCHSPNRLGIESSDDTVLRRVSRCTKKGLPQFVGY